MASTKAPSVPLKSVALPVEHGGWGFTLEPILLGLILAPSWPGAALGLLGLFAFLARHPIKLALNDVRRGHVYPRTTLAAKVGALYASLAFAGLLAAYLWGEHAFLIPLFVSLPLVAYQMAQDAKGQSRTLAAELAGALASGALASAIVLAGGGDPVWAWGSWFLLALRSLVAVRYARAQVRRARGQTASLASVLATGLLASLLALLGAWQGALPWLGAGAIWALSAYAVMMLRRPPIPARAIGWGQMFWGWTTVLLIAVGYRFGL